MPCGDRLSALGSILLLALAGCAKGAPPVGASGDGGVAGPTTTAVQGAGGATGVGGFTPSGAGGGCTSTCSSDFETVLDCNGGVLATCTGSDRCDASSGTCAAPCIAAQGNKQSVGCEYYATFMDTFRLTACFAAMVANTTADPVHIAVERDGASLPVESFTRIPAGS